MSSVLRFPVIVGRTGKIVPILPDPVDRRRGARVTAHRPSRVGRPTNVAADPLVLEAIATAFESLQLIERRTGEVAWQFRVRHLDEAYSGLTDLISATQTLLDLAAAAATQMTGGHENEHTERASESMRGAISDIIAAQRTGDLTALARALDYQYRPALDTWRGVLERLCGLADGPGPSGHAA
jgi:hypothetical protein